MAIASPNTTWQVGTRRRRSSLSSAGRSSWMREYVWIISRPQAGARAGPDSPPIVSAAARQRIGRSRLPPAKRECRMARWGGARQAVSEGSNRDSSRSTSSLRAARQSLVEGACGIKPPVSIPVRFVVRGAGGVGGFKRRGLPLAGGFLQDDLDGFLNVRQLSVAEAGEGHAFLEELELLLEAELVGFDRGDDRLQALHRLFESLFLLNHRLCPRRGS